MTADARAAAPALDIDLYADAVLRDSREAFARVREAAPVVWLPRHGVYALGRFEDVRAALRNDAVFRSGDGVAVSPITNRLGRGTTLFSDAEVHSTRRRVLMRSLGAKPLAGIRERVGARAQELIERLAARRSFDAVSEFASHLPLTVVAELVGIDRDPQVLLRWGSAAFDGLGPANRRALWSGRFALGLLMYTRRLGPGMVRPGSWAASVFDALAGAEITREEAQALIIDFVAPALDTTILASTHLLWVLARNPDAWEEIRRDPELIAAAVVENVRLASPIRGFARKLSQGCSVDGVELPAGARVLLLFGAANLDETRFPAPERFDVHRADPNHVGWGYGPHTCVGIHLAKLEMQSLLQAMATRVDSIGAGGAVRLVNNTLQGIAGMSAGFVVARGQG